MQDGKRAYKYRLAFGPWINDMTNEAMPLENWPYGVIDDKTVDGITRALDVQSEAGYNAIDIGGLHAILAWPVDIASVADRDRQRRVNKILKAAHEREMKVICVPAGVMSWGFDAIIEHDPAVRTDKEHVMNPLREESWEWQRKVFDFVIDNYDVDGVHLESADLGRSETKESMEKWPDDVEYHRYITGRTADYIRGKRPDMWLTAALTGWGTPGKDFTDEEKDQLVELSRSVDCIFDQGHHRTYIPQAERRDFIQRLECDYGTSGGLWAYVGQRWERQRWFLPYTIRTGTHIKQLYEDGGRGIMFYQGPTINPSTEVNIAFGGRIMSDAGRSVEDVLAEVLETLYKPKSEKVHRQLVDIFQRAESAYFDQWPDEEFLEYGTPKRRMPPPGELIVATLLGVSPGPAIYLTEPFLDTEGRVAYKEGLLSVLKELSEIENGFRDEGRIKRIQECVSNVLLDINNIGMARNETKVWQDAPQHV